MSHSMNVAQPLGPKAGTASATYTPAASSHTGLDSVGGAQTMTIPGSAGRIIKLTGYRFSIATTTPVASVFTAFLYNSTPTVVADDDAYAVVAADGPSKFLGIVAIAQPTDFTSTWLESQGLIAGQYIQMVTDTLTVYLQLTTTATLEAVAHKLTLFYEIQP